MACLDSSIIIDILRGKISISEVKNKFDSLNEQIFIPSPAIIELVRGLYLRDSIKNIKENEKENINNFLSSFQVLDLRKESAIKTGEIEAELRNMGEIIDLEDIMIGPIELTKPETVSPKNKKLVKKIKNLRIESY